MEVVADAVEAQVASLGEDGLTHINCSSFDTVAWIFWSLHAATVICPCEIYQKGTSASPSPDGRLPDLLRQERDSDGLSFVWFVCLSPRHSRAHRGHDIIATVAFIAAIVGVIARTDSRNYCVTRLEVNIQADVRVNIHASLNCLVGFRNTFASTPWRSTRSGRCF